MLPNFPELRPDELLYSGIARYVARWGIRSATTVRGQIYGAACAWTAVVELPGALRHLAAQLPRPDLLHAEDLLLRNTTYPYYASFQTAQRRERARDMLLEGGARGVHGILGARRGRVRAPEYLQFCAACAEEDVQAFGEPASWRRIHQLAGVRVCPTHETPLAISTLPRTPARPDRWRFHPLDAHARATATRDTVASQDLRVLLLLARGSAFLLDHGARIPENPSSLYRPILAQAGWLDQQGRLRATAIAAAAEAFYSPSLLQELGTPIQRSRTTWVTSAIQGRARHPVHHLLLLHFLEMEPTVLFGADGPRQTSVTTPSARAQQPLAHCRVPACDRYAAQESSRTLRDSYLEYACPHCGCAWRVRNGRPELVRTGEVWEHRLRHQWSTSVRRSVLAEHFGVGIGVLYKHARRLGLLSAPIPHARRASTDGSSGDDRDRSWIRRQRTLHANWSRTALERSGPTRYARLWRRDPVFMEATLPEPRSIGAMNRRNWASEDRYWAPQIEAAVQRLLARPGRPARLTQRAIAREAEFAPLLAHLRRLPECRGEIECALWRENGPRLIERRLAWAAAELANRGEVLSRWALVRTAGYARIAAVPALLLDDVLRESASAHGPAEAGSNVSQAS